MSRLFTYLFSAGLFLLCVFSDDLFPQNMSYSLLSTVERNAIKDRNEIFEDMKAVVTNGFVKVELYSDEGKLVDTLEAPEDFTEEIKLAFTTKQLNMRTVEKTPSGSMP